MTPNPSPDMEPGLKEVNKVETEPVSNIESKTEPSYAKSVVMAPIKFKCTVGGCSFETDELKQTVVAQVLGMHSDANHVVRGAHSGPGDKLQKLDHPILTTNFSQQDFGFFKEEWRRYATRSNTKDENLL